MQRLYLLPEFDSPGTVCRGCNVLQPADSAERCRFCGDAVQPIDLGEAMTSRVLASGGRVGLTGRHAALSSRGGVGAILRYAA